MDRCASRAGCRDGPGGSSDVQSPTTANVSCGRFPEALPRRTENAAATSPAGVEAGVKSSVPSGSPMSARAASVSRGLDLGFYLSAPEPIACPIMCRIHSHELRRVGGYPHFE